LNRITQERNFKVESVELADSLTPKFYYPLYRRVIETIEKKFKTVHLGKISQIARGNEPGSDNYISFSDKQDSDIPFIRTSDIGNYEIDNYPDFYISQKVRQHLNQDIKENDILFTNDGKVKFYPKPKPSVIRSQPPSFVCAQNFYLGSRFFIDVASHFFINSIFR
jgi:type I restriction enzyme S subunit